MLLEDRAHPTSDERDEVILARSLRDPRDFKMLVERYEDAFYRKAFRILNDREAAEDTVQETFTKIYLHASRFSEANGGTFKSWAFTILTNTALTLYRKRKREFAAIVHASPEEYAAYSDKGVVSEERELTDYVASILTTLPRQFSRALRLHFFEGKSYKEISRLEGTSVGAIKTRVYRAKEMIRNTLPSYM